jgi:hypothetical protein
MLRKLVILFSLAIALVLSVAAQAAFQQPRPGQPPSPPEQEPPPAMAVPPTYRFDPSGRRDPFVNPVPKPRPETLVPIIRPKGLPGVLISEAQLAGIVWSHEAEMNRAVIAAPGGRTYFARKGDALYDAVIKDIERDGVVFQVKAKDREGNPTVEEVVRRVRTTP